MNGQKRIRERSSRPSATIMIYLLQLGGGAGKMAVNYANHLARRGYLVQLLCGKQVEEKLSASLGTGVNLLRLNVSRSWLAIFGMTVYMRQFKPDLVIVMGASNFFPVSIAHSLTRSGSSILLREANSPFGLLQSYSFLKRKIKMLTFASAFRRSDCLIALTQAMKREFEIDWKIPTSKISVIYNGVTLPEQVEFDFPYAAIPTILCVARLTPQKDLSTLLHAFAFVNKNLPCRLQIAGEGDEYSSLLKLSSTLGITDKVEFLGYVDNVGNLYRNASVTVVSSKFEGFPNVLVEALAYGCPIVATDCPTGPSEIISGSEIGLLAEIGNPNDLALKLLESLNTHYDRKKLFERAVFFSQKNMKKKIDVVVDELLS